MRQKKVSVLGEMLQMTFLISVLDVDVNYFKSDCGQFRFFLADFENVISEIFSIPNARRDICIQLLTFVYGSDPRIYDILIWKWLTALRKRND